ncbi:unnamed protein product [Rotaria sordida]|uniref:NHL repeat containing protein n=1 Tax=Rotaria sordida TaxID=392033 RepID=A0A813XR95_9BILA|nr:unnamed protein product [Rotaria sordida]
MIWIRDRADQIHPTLDSLRYTYSQHQQRVAIQQDLYQHRTNWKVIGSFISFTIFVMLLFTTVVGIPIILTEVRKRSVCSVTYHWVQYSTLNSSIHLCTATALWNSKGVTVAGLASGLPSTSLAGLQFPHDIYVYGNGTILVADYNNNRITKWDPNATAGILIAGTGSYGSSNILLAKPTALAIRDKQLYVSDLENYRIQIFPLHSNASSPEAVTVIGRYGQGSDINQIDQVTNLIVPTLYPSLLYMADSKNHRILVWDAETDTTRLVAGESGTFGFNPMQLYNPIGIALDEKTNSLYIADTFNNRVQKYDINERNSSMTVAGWGHLNHPYAVQLDPSGTNMFIADTFNHRILVWTNGTRQGRVIAGDNTPGNNAFQLNNPTQIRFDSNYNLYVVDTNNSRIQRFDLISNGC